MCGLPYGGVFMHINMPPEVRFILDKLDHNGFEGFIVGGCVRDSLLGRKASDWDIATNALPQDTINIFKDGTLYLSGIDHGTVTIIVNCKSFEITTYRVEGMYRDYRRPESVCFSSFIEEDLKRRDFTVNAMAYNITRGLIDVFGGIMDIKDKVIRCVGNAHDRFNEDALRMLRAIRFSATLGFRIEAETYKAIQNNSYLIKNISSERIRDEITRIISSSNPENIVLISSCSLLKFIVPEILPERTYMIESQNIGYRSQNLNTALHMYDSFETRLALLLHEMICHKLLQDSNPGDTSSLLEAAEIILKKLKFEKRITKKITLLLKFHDTEIHEDKKSIRLWLNNIGKDNLKDLLRFKKCIAVSSAPGNYSRDIDSIDRISEALESIIQDGNCYDRYNLAINGEDLKNMGYNDGMLIGKIINTLLQVVIEDPKMNTKDKLTDYLNTNSFH